MTDYIKFKELSQLAKSKSPYRRAVSIRKGEDFATSLLFINSTDPELAVQSKDFVVSFVDTLLVKLSQVKNAKRKSNKKK